MYIHMYKPGHAPQLRPRCGAKKVRRPRDAMRVAIAELARGMFIR